MAGASVTGRVIDSKTGAPLPGAVVYFPLQGLGKVVDDSGGFRFDSLAPGVYTLNVSLIGYIVREANFELQDHDKVGFSFELIPTVLALGDEIIVSGRRPAIDMAEPSTARVVRGDELDRAAIGIVDAARAQAGVTQVDRELHVRGARSYETDYRLDGVSVADPYLRLGMAVQPPMMAIRDLTLYSGSVRPDQSGTNGGLVAVETLEPSPSLSGQATYATDALSPTSPGDWNTDHAEIVVSGPLYGLGLPRFSSDPTFEPGIVAAVNGLLMDTHLGSGDPYSSVLGGSRWSPRSDNEYHSLLKLSWRVSPVHRFTALFTNEADINQDRSVLDTHLRTATYSYGWPFVYSRDLENATTFTRQSNAQILRWYARPGAHAGTTLTLSRVFTRLHGDVNGKSPSEYIPPNDTGPTIFEPSPDSSYYTVKGGDGFYDVGDGDLWHDHFVETHTVRADVELDPRRFWQLKSGIEAAHQTIQMIDIFRPWIGLGGLNTDHYRASPTTASWWAESRLNYSGTIIDFGLRGDLWWPGRYLEGLVADTTLPNITPAMRQSFLAQTSEIFGQRARFWLTPRLAIAHSLSPSLSFLGSYSQFSQSPNPRYLYAKLQSRSPSSFQLLGNPALKPERTIAVEAGFKWVWNSDWGLTATAYQRDMHDYVAAVAVIPNPDFPDDFWYAYANHDMAQTRGVECTLDGRIHSGPEINAMAAISRVTGESSIPEDIFRGRVSREGEVLLDEVRLDWDTPWRMAATIRWDIGQAGDVDRGHMSTLPAWNFRAGYSAQAGKRYTPYRDTISGEGDTLFVRADAANSRLGPYWASLNLSCTRNIPVGRTLVSLFVTVTNIFNHRNVTLINPLTGKGYAKGDRIPTGDNFFETAPPNYDLPIWDDPSGYDNPVHWQFGVRWSWGQ